MQDSSTIKHCKGLEWPILVKIFTILTKFEASDERKTVIYRQYIRSEGGALDMVLHKRTIKGKYTNDADFCIFKTRLHVCESEIHCYHVEFSRMRGSAFLFANLLRNVDHYLKFQTFAHPPKALVVPQDMLSLCPKDSFEEALNDALSSVIEMIQHECNNYQQQGSECLVSIMKQCHSSHHVIPGELLMGPISTMLQSGDDEIVRRALIVVEWMGNIFSNGWLQPLLNHVKQVHTLPKTFDNAAIRRALKRLQNIQGEGFAYGKPLTDGFMGVTDGDGLMGGTDADGCNPEEVKPVAAIGYVEGYLGCEGGGGEGVGGVAEYLEKLANSISDGTDGLFELLKASMR